LKNKNYTEEVLFLYLLREQLGMFYTDVMCLITSSIFWTALTALFTGCLFAVAWSQLIKINKTTSANFLIDFKNNFFTPENR
jgi:hypothetical protein